MRNPLSFLFKGKTSKQIKPLLQVPLAPDWTDAHMKEWRKFAESPTGQCLLIRARAMQVATCVNACDGKGHPQMASGITFTLNWLETMATISGDSPDKESTTENQNDVTEALEYEHV